VKEPFSLEELTSSKHITFMERSLPTLAFTPGRNIGIMADNAVLDSRMTWAAGAFWSTGSLSDVGEGKDAISQSNGFNLTARITGLPLYAEEGRKLLHLGLSYSHEFRRNVASDAQVVYKPRPESHLTDNRLVNTDTFSAESVDLINPELAIVTGPLSFQGETYLSIVDAPALGDPRLWGYYVFGSYFLTGENRNYQTSHAVFAKVDPKNNFHFGNGGWGAWELGLRYAYVDLNDEALKGGKERNITAGLNWYLNPKTRFMLNYIRANVKDRLSPPRVKDGHANIWQARFQIEF
jgi:phosphate-selective porin OprO/OprP